MAMSKTVFLKRTFILCIILANYTVLIAQTGFIANGKSFQHKGWYPKQYTCDSLGISPALQWSGAPTATQSYVITMHHIAKDGEKHVYMVLYDIPSQINSIPDAVTGIGKWGVNTVNRQNNYTPPCSKGPGPKAYIITVYALSEKPNMVVPSNRLTMDLLLDAIKPITLASSIIEVTYSRPQ